ncbi:MAG: hypothetical protein C4297_07160 [Gemmataceae bacterium]
MEANTGDRVTFFWRKGEILTYELTQRTRASSRQGDVAVELSSQVVQQRQWEVVDCDELGGARLRLTLAGLRFQQQLPNGRVLLYDAQKPQDSDPQLRRQLEPMLRQPLVTLTIDAAGKVGKVHEVRPSAMLITEAIFPMHVVWPTPALSPGASWQSDYTLTLRPPLGTGSHYAARRHFRWEMSSTPSALWRVSFRTELLQPARDSTDQMALLQFQPEGEVFFDRQRRRVIEVRWRCGGVLENHLGPGSRYEVQIEAEEKLLPAP